MKSWDWILGALCASWLLALIWIGAPQHQLFAAIWSGPFAAWLQAIGSVLAIFAATTIASRQSREQRAKEKEQLNARRDSGMHLMAVMYATVKATVDHAHKDVSPEAIIASAKRLEGFPFWELEDQELAGLLFFAVQNLAALAARCDELAKKSRPENEVIADIEDISQAAKNELDQYRSRLKILTS